ncbi:uncharacterized protein LOC143375714 isoform X2 [Andrena cerasifolii]|uniref:uncharacterized protein LOC143375714 isoform X2 n=1 Tax=Andrena cerasifolii TaxID=2819439 RepID=UPI0040377226
MPRSMRESDDEVDVKVGRKTRGLAGSVAVESPLRRSSRIKPTTKHYESSPESSLSDASNVSNTQITRATRRRVGTMDNSAATEKNRTLRSRRNSVASDVSEPTDTDVLATPTKKTKGIAVRDILNKPNNRASKRSTRAGSEAKSSPPISRVTRRMRASSMEPEGNMEVTETPPIKSKRRASVLPSEATVAEEKEVMKIAVIALDRTLPNVKEINESGLEKSLKSVRSKKSTSDEDLDEKRKEDNIRETPAETTEEVPEKGELSKKTSLSDDPSTSRKSVDKVQSNNKEKKSEGKGETPKKNLESMEVDDNDSDTNTANLFQDIPADEWKEKGADVDKDSVHSMSTERLENESENECDLILVDREAWLAAENIKLKKENEPFDYDSDDTVVLKSRRDSLKATGEGKMTLDVILEDECKMNVSKRKSLNTSSKRRSTKQAETGDREDVEEDPGDIGLGAEDTEGIEEAKDTECTRKRKSISKQTDEQSTPKCNVSLQKSVGEKSLSESQQATETKETSDKSFTNSPLSKSKLSDNTPKKRKSLNKSVQEMDDKAEISSECEFEKKRKSLNKSKLKESDIAETESSNENIIIRGKKNKSSNNSPKKRVKTRQLDPNLIEESDNECKESEVNEKKSSSTKKTLHRNYSTAVNLESDSDASRDNIDSQDSEDESVKWPKFLYGGESNSDSDNENESNKSIDSDIRREYNLDGEEVTEFADDDVPGDECRASETESSDPDDDGSDLLDFVVDDDEDDEAEEEKEEDEDGDQEETKTVENEEDLNNEEDANEDDEEEEVVVDEEEEVVIDEEVADEDEEMKVTEEVDSIEEKEQSEDEQESVEKVNKSLDTSKKGMNKLRKSADSSLTPMTENNKGKKRRLKTDTSLTEKDEKECNLSTISLSTSLKGKKSKQKRVFNEFTDDAKQLLNDSPTILNTKTEKLFKSMECSTPKTSSSKLEKFSINQHTPDVTLEASCKNLSREIREGKEDTSPDKEEAQDKAQKIEKNAKKLRKLKDKENPMHRSLPSELIELVEKTNVSSVTSSKVTELNKTTPIPNSESPTVMHLRKERLNDSAPELKLSSKSRRKSIKNSTNKLSNSLKEFKEENAAVEEQAEEPTTEVNDSLKKKLLKVADNILESDRQKKRKKRKQVAVEQNSVQFSEVNFEENINSRITKKKQQRDDSTGIVVKNEQEKETSVDKKKKKKKKKKVVSMEVDAPVVNESPENLIETDLENNNEPIHNDEKKKKKKGKKIKDGIESQVPAKKKAKNGKKIAVPYEEVSVIKASKKRQKWSEDVASESEQVSIEKVPKKKQKLSKDAALEQEEASDKKLRKKKQKLLSHDTNSQVEKSSPKKLSKKKDKLSSENVMAAIKSQQSGDVASDSDEGPEVVAFSKARDEALGIIKRTADGIKANKEIKKKKQREHLERMQAEKEIKIQKLESKSQMKKSKVVEMQKKSVKRLPDDVLENLSDIPSKPLKKRKLCQFDDEVLPSRSTFNFMDKETRDIHIEDDILSLPSSAGSTTQFDVVNLQKLKKKKKAAVVSFRQKMLARNSRHPVSAYLMYLEKQKASGKDKFCNKP